MPKYQSYTQQDRHLALAEKITRQLRATQGGKSRMYLYYAPPFTYALVLVFAGAGTCNFARVPGLGTLFDRLLLVLKL